MAIVKIVSDYNCRLFCNGDYIKDLNADEEFECEVPLGKSQFEYKDGDESLLAEEVEVWCDYPIMTKKVCLSKIVAARNRERDYDRIKSLSRYIRDYKKGSELVDTSTHEVIAHYSYLTPFYMFEYGEDGVDKAGLLPINIGGYYENIIDYGTEVFGGKWGCLNKEGHIQIPLIYDNKIWFRNDQAAIAIRNGKKQFINKWGEDLLQFEYDDLLGFEGDYCVFVKDSSKGVIDKYGRIILPALFEEIVINELHTTNLDDRNRYILFTVKSGHRWSVFNSSGIQCTFKPYTEIKVEIFFIFLKNEDGKWEVLIPEQPIGKHIYDAYHAHYDEFSASINGKWGRVNKKGEVVIPFEFSFDDDKECRVVKYKDKYGLIFDFRYHGSSESFMREFKEENFMYDGYDGKYLIKNLENGKTLCWSEKREFVCDSYDSEYFCIDNVWHPFDCQELSFPTKPLYHFYDLYSYTINGEFIIQKRYEVVCKVETLGYDCSLYTDRFLNSGYYVVKQGNRFRIVSKPVGYGEYIVSEPFWEILSYTEGGNIEVAKKINGRTLYGTYSLRDAELIEDCVFLSRKYQESHWNWVEKYDTNRKEIIIARNTGSEVFPGSSEAPKEYVRFVHGSEGGTIILYKDKASSNISACTYSRPWRKIELSPSVTVGYSGDDSRFRISAGEYVASVDLDYLDFFNSFPFIDFVKRRTADEIEQGVAEKHGNPFSHVTLFVDTETTGLPKDDGKSPYDVDNWPRLVQVGYILEDAEFGILVKGTIIMKPDGFVIPQEAIDIHHISNEKAKKGVDRKVVINYLDLLLSKCKTVIGHNVDFDLNVIKAEIIREKGAFADFEGNDELEVVDTMEQAKAYFNIEYNITLGELYKKLTARQLTGAHSADNDVEATKLCFDTMKTKEKRKIDDSFILPF